VTIPPLAKMTAKSDMATCQPHEDAMTFRLPALNNLALLLAAGAAIAIGLSATSADAAAKKKKYYDANSTAYGPGGPNVSYQQGPHTRIYISRRSWLDAGTEVLPGDRKFTDYAFPPELGYPSFARENNNRPIDRQPLSPPSDLGGFPQRTTPLY
jgi:hypothetical protein